MADKTRSTVEKERAMEHSLLTMRRSWAGDVADLEGWGKVELDPDPLEIYDLNGQRLFWEFNAMDGKRQVGRLKASASKLVGAPVMTIELGKRRWQPRKAKRKAAKLAQKLHPKAKVSGTRLVCYSYPKIGVRVDIRDKKLGKKSLIFDVSDLSQVTRFGIDESEGQTAWSYLDNMSSRRAEEGKRFWNLRDRDLELARSETPDLFASAFTAREAKKVKMKVVPRTPYNFSWFSSKVVKFGPRCSPHECFELYAQKTNVYCAVATGQMILDFYRYYYGQTDIAAAMSTGSGGTSNSGQVAGYESLSNGGLDATYDGTANWTEAKQEIDANRPLKSGIPGHARACAGWKRANIWLAGQPQPRWLKIYDPWPWNSNICSGGAVYWEDWYSVYHTNFIYVRHPSRRVPR